YLRQVASDKTPRQRSAVEPWQGPTAPLDTEIVESEPIRRFALVRMGSESLELWQSRGDRCALGSHEANDFVIDDPTVSRFHCEIHIEGTLARLRDLGSRNGTFVDGLRIVDAYLRDGSQISLGKHHVRFQFEAGELNVPVSPRQQFGEIVGDST